jgi:sarcosine oxidase subunit gamma
MSDRQERDQTRVWMQQLPSGDVRVESPLYHADLPSMMAINDDAGADTAGGVALAELPLQAHLVIRGRAEAPGFQESLTQALGLQVPTRLSSVSDGSQTLRWIGPDEWLLTAPASQAFDIETKLRAALPGHVAVVDVSGGNTILLLSGLHARSVLKKSTSYDVSDRNFPLGKVVTTTMGKSQAVIRRVDELGWELIIRRSFADYLWLWLQDASAEYGLSVHE